MTGKPKLDTQAYRDYFAPLEQWLDKYAKDNNIVVGWSNPDYGKLCQASASDQTSDKETTTSALHAGRGSSVLAPVLLVTMTSVLSLGWKML